MGLFGSIAGAAAGAGGNANLAGLLGGAARGNLNGAQVAKLEKLAGGRGFGGNLAQKFLNKYRASQANQNTPSVVQTAGGYGMTNRINQIEGRLNALERSNTSSSAPQPAAVAPAETPAPSASTEQLIEPISGTPIPTNPAAVPPAAENLAPVADALGEKFSASPFFQRQRANSGPLNLNSPLNGNAFAKAVQDAKASGASSFEVGGKTYNVK